MNPTFEAYFKSIKAVTLNDDGTENTTLATWDNPQVNASDTDGSKGQAMVRLPRLWYKEYLDANDKLNGIDIANYPKPGLTLHPKFSYGGGREYIYVGMYEASGATTLQSISGVNPITSITLATFRSRAAARGSGWHQLDFWTQHLLDLLFYAYFGDRDAKEALPGYIGLDAFSTSYIREAGRSNVLDAINGSIEWDPGTETGGTWSGGLDSDIAQAIEDEAVSWRAGFDPIISSRFLFMENPYGHIYKMNDGVAVVPSLSVATVGDLPAEPDNGDSYRVDADGKYYEWHAGDEEWKDRGSATAPSFVASPNPTQFSSLPAEILEKYTKIDVDPVAIEGDDYIKNVGKAFIPVELGASSSTHFASQQYNRLSAADRPYLRLVRAGGRLNLGASAGIALRHVNFALGISATRYGSRLCYEKI